MCEIYEKLKKIVNGFRITMFFYESSICIHLLCLLKELERLKELEKKQREEEERRRKEEEELYKDVEKLAKV